MSTQPKAVPQGTMTARSGSFGHNFSVTTGEGSARVQERGRQLVTTGEVHSVAAAIGISALAETSDRLRDVVTFNTKNNRHTILDAESQDVLEDAIGLQDDVVRMLDAELKHKSEEILDLQEMLSDANAELGLTPDEILAQMARLNRPLVVRSNSKKLTNMLLEFGAVPVSVSKRKTRKMK
jgi:hypothetical protein